MSNIIRFVGDIHGNYKPLIDAANCEYQVIQVGDFGAGFVDIPELPSNVRWIRGNHDDPAIAKMHPQWIPDGHYENGILFVGGAYSIDRDRRHLGISSWEDEELSYGELNDIIDKAIDLKPHTIVSHEAPLCFLEQFGFCEPSRTSLALNSIYQEVKPNLWVFGHHHRSIKTKMDNTLFVCCDIDQVVDIDMTNLYRSHRDHDGTHELTA